MQGDIRGALEQATDLQALFDVVARGARRLGFEQCAYGLCLGLPFTNPKTLIISNYDARWQRRYCDAGYLRIDPTVAHGMRSDSPLIWSNDLFCHAPQLWSEARSFGLRVGWAQSCFGAAGTVGMLSVARSHDALAGAEITARDADLRWLVTAAHAKLSAALCRAHGVERPVLTAREAEVLRWTADGKTCEEVGLLLRISVNTVKFHVRNAVEKLHVANKTAAVASAAALGLL